MNSFSLNRWLRNTRLTSRIWLGLSILLLPLAILTQFYHSAIEQRIEENRYFSDTIPQIQQLARLQELIAQYRGLNHGLQQSADDRSSEPLSVMIQELHSNIGHEMETLKELDLDQQQIRLTDSIQKLWLQLSTSENSASEPFDFHGYTYLISQVQHLIKQLTGRSAPRFYAPHPERTTLFTLSSNTLSALKEQMGRLRGLTYGVLHNRDRKAAAREFETFLPPLRNEIAIERKLIRDQLASVYQQNQALYSESFTLFSDYSIDLAALVELLDWELESIRGGATSMHYLGTADKLFEQVSNQIEMLDQLNDTLLNHVSHSLQQENEELEQQLHRNLLLLALILLTAALSVYWILHLHNRSNQQLLIHLQQRELLQKGGEVVVERTSLDREYRLIWDAYHLLEQSLEHETARLLTLKQGLDRAAMIMITNLDGTITYANDALLKRSGYRESEFIGQNPRILQSGLTSKEHYIRLWKTILEGKIWKNQVANRDRFGQTFWVEETIVPLRNDQNNVHEFFAIYFDITTQVLAEQHLEEQLAEMQSVQTLTTQGTQNEAADIELECEPLMGLPPSIEDENVVSDMVEESSSSQIIRVLAIDDEPLVLEGYRALLQGDSSQLLEQEITSILGQQGQDAASESNPFELVCTESGEAGAELLYRAKAEGTPFQVVYLDMVMPNGWDGLKTAQELLRVDPQVRIIIISAWSEHSPAELKPILGDHFIYLKKPFSRSELLQITHYMAEDWRRTRQLLESRHALTRASVELQQSYEERQKELDHQRIYQMVLVSLSTSAPLYSGDRKRGYQEITQATLEALGSDRVTLWHLEQDSGDESYLVADDCYSVRLQSHEVGARIPLREYESIWELVNRRQVVRIDNLELYLTNEADQHYCKREDYYYNQHNIHALMIAPIYFNGSVMGIIAAEMERPRSWNLEEATFLSYVSNLVPTIEISAARKDAEQQAAAANRAKDDFLATMSHELRTPLSSMIGYSDLLGEGALSREQHDLVETIRLAGKTLLALVNDILDISKIEAGKFELDPAPFTLQSLIHEMEMMFSTKAEMTGVVFNIATPSPLPTVQLHGDGRRISQILINLIGNALKFTSREGHVTLQIHCDAADESQDPPLTLCHFAIEDSGIGIAEDKIGRLFRPFEQADGTISRSFGGTGLGLYISRMLANLMEGDIHLQSVEGEGSTFTLRVPLELTELPLPEQGALPHQTRITAEDRLKGRVLIVEDTIELQQLERRMVEATGATVETANDGEEGMALALAGSYDLILMDMQMPNMDGITATQLLRSSSVSTPIVALTANVMQQHRDQFYAAGCDDFLSKPIVRSDLLRVLHTYLEIDTDPISNTDSSDHSELPRELLELFTLRMKESAEEIEAFHQQQDWEALKGAVHMLKGTGSSFGHPEITEQAKRVEMLLLEERHAELKPPFEVLLEMLMKASEQTHS